MPSTNQRAASGRSRTLKLVAGGILAGLVVAGCGATKIVTDTVTKTVTDNVTAPTQTVTMTNTVTAPARTVTVTRNAASSASTCAVYVTGANARLKVFGRNATSQCATIVGADPGGDGWTTVRQPTKDSYSDPLSAVCALQNPSGTLNVVVSDSGFQVYGTDACNYLTDAGWTTSTP